MLLLVPVLHAAELSPVLGTRDSLAEAKMVEGLRAGARLGSGPWEAELVGYVSPDSTRASDLDAILLVLAEGSSFYQVSDADRLALSLSGSWGPRPDGAWWGAPRLVAGLELRDVTRSWLSLADTEATGQQATVHLDATRQLLAPGALVGFALDSRLGGPLGLRLSVLDRLWLASERRHDEPLATGDPDLRQDPTIALDLSWSFTVGGAE